MAKTILIPIDFSVESLNTLRLALSQHRQETVNVVLMYAEYLSSSITELLFYAPNEIIQSLTSPQFYDAINIIKNSYEFTIQSITIELFHGSNISAFRNFCETNEIDLIYLPLNYRLAPKKNGFDPIPLIKKSKVQFFEVNWNFDNMASYKDELNQLFK